MHEKKENNESHTATEQNRGVNGNIIRARITQFAFGLNTLFFLLIVYGFILYSQQHEHALREIEIQQPLVTDLQTQVKPLELQAQVLQFVRANARGIHGQKVEQVTQTIIEQADFYHIDTVMLLALIQVESSFRNYAVSDRGAIGLMQIQPSTAAHLCEALGLNWDGPHSLFDPELNIRLGCYYLSELRKRFGNIEYALEAYNKGPTRVASQLARGKRVIGVYSAAINDVNDQFIAKLEEIPT